MPGKASEKPVPSGCGKYQSEVGGPNHCWRTFCCERRESTPERVDESQRLSG